MQIAVIYITNFIVVRIFGSAVLCGGAIFSVIDNTVAAHMNKVSRTKAAEPKQKWLDLYLFCRVFLVHVRTFVIGRTMRGKKSSENSFYCWCSHCGAFERAVQTSDFDYQHGLD